MPAATFTERPNQNNDECDLCSCGKACRNNRGVATKLVVDMTAFLAEFAARRRARTHVPERSSPIAVRWPRSSPGPQKPASRPYYHDGFDGARRDRRKIAFAAVATPK